MPPEASSRGESGTGGARNLKRVEIAPPPQISRLGFGFGVQGLGFRVQGSGFRVWGLGFGVWGLGFRVSGFGFRVESFGFGVWGLGSRPGGQTGCNPSGRPRQTPLTGYEGGSGYCLAPYGTAYGRALAITRTRNNYPVGVEAWVQHWWTNCRQSPMKA